MSDTPDLRALVQRFWGPMLAEHGFAEVFSNDHSSDHQLTIYASPDCQVKFVFDTGAIDILFGRIDAPRTFADKRDGQNVWFTMSSVLAYENEIHPDQRYRLPPEAPRDETRDEACLRTTAALTRPYMPRIIVAFSPHPPEGWWMGYRFARARDQAAFTSLGTRSPPT